MDRHPRTKCPVTCLKLWILSMCFKQFLERDGCSCLYIADPFLKSPKCLPIRIGRHSTYMPPSCPAHHTCAPQGSTSLSFFTRAILSAIASALLRLCCMVLCVARCLFAAKSAPRTLAWSANLTSSIHTLWSSSLCRAFLHTIFILLSFSCSSLGLTTGTIVQRPVPKVLPPITPNTLAIL